MKILRWVACLILASAVVGCNQNSESSGAAAGEQDRMTGSEQQEAAESPSSVEANNTGRNVRDRSEQALTPGDQGRTEADREMTRRIRRGITENDQLSADAKNIKIITIDGKVTLRGPVKNSEELSTIQGIVHQMGGTSVDNQLEVKTTNQ